MTKLLSALTPFRNRVATGTAVPRLLLAPLAVAAAALAADVGALAAQDDMAGNAVEIGLGGGAGTGRFGGPGMAVMFYVGGPATGLSLGGEFVGVFRREHYVEGGLFFPDPGSTRTMPRWSMSVVGRAYSPSGVFGKLGLGFGAVTGRDLSVQDATPLKSFFSLVTTLGVGGRWSLGGLRLAPRADAMLHLGGEVRLTGVMGLAVAVF